MYVDHAACKHLGRLALILGLWWVLSMADCILRTIYDYFKNTNNYDNVFYVYEVLWYSLDLQNTTTRLATFLNL